MWVGPSAPGTGRCGGGRSRSQDDRPAACRGVFACTGAGGGGRGRQAWGGDGIESYSDSNSQSQGSCRLPGAPLPPGTVAARTQVYLDESVDRGVLQSLPADVGLYTCRKPLKIHFFGFGENYSDMFTHVCHDFNSFKKCAHFSDEV